MFHDPDNTPGDSSQIPADPVIRKPDLSIPSADLLKGRREVLIQHEGETYRLRVTKNGKLILHK